MSPPRAPLPGLLCAFRPHPLHLGIHCLLDFVEHLAARLAGLQVVVAFHGLLQWEGSVHPVEGSSTRSHRGDMVMTRSQQR